jgi:hypothetical protein
MPSYVITGFSLALYLAISLTVVIPDSVAAEGTRSAEVSLTQAQLIEAKRIGIMLGKNRPFIDVHSNWKKLVAESEMTQKLIKPVLTIIFSEALRVTSEDKTRLLEKLKIYEAIAEKLEDELHATEAISQQETMVKLICRREFDWRDGAVVAKREEAVAEKAMINSCNHALRQELSFVQHDSNLIQTQARKIEKRQLLLKKPESTISRILYDTALGVVQRTRVKD